MPAIEVPPPKRRKLGRTFESIGCSTQSLEALLRVAEVIEKQTAVLQQICNAVMKGESEIQQRNDRG